MNEVAAEKLLDERNHYLSAGDLRKLLADDNIPDDAMVLIENVDDCYYKGGVDVTGVIGRLEDGTYGPLPEGSRSSEWPVVLMDNIHTSWMKEHNEKVDNGFYKDKENFPEFHPIHEHKYADEDIHASKTLFGPAHCITADRKNSRVVYIHMHY